MALNDDAVLTAAVGYVFKGPIGTPAPTPTELAALDLTTFASLHVDWAQVGHTSRDDMPEFGFTGGDTTVKGTWQKKRLREIATGDPVADFVKITLEQFDSASLALYYGADAAATPGVFGVDGNFTPVEAALLVIIVDGDVVLGFYSAKASIKRDDSINLPVDDFAGLPIKATFLDHPGFRLYDWINEDLFGPVTPPSYSLNLHGATAGTLTLKVAGTATGSITVSGISTTSIKAALVAVDDGFDASDFTVTGSGPYAISSPAVVTLGTDSSTGGTGVTVS